MKTVVLACVAAAAPLGLVASAASADVLNMTIVIRDFRAFGTTDGHPDFEAFGADDRGMVGLALGADGTPVYQGAPTTPTTTGAANFAQWYHDVPGVNQTFVQTIPLDNGQATPGGVYTYTNNEFFPIDGLGWGNQGNNHNFHFTVQAHTTFTYQAGQVFNFTGDDDLWVYINRTLVIDLGGVHGAEGASVNLDTLGLVAGNTYDFDLFFAERHTSASTFAISTSIPIPTPSAAAVLGLGAAAAIGRRRGR
ncbi:MAG: fibro-slime domain-containing protein [Phycisphaerales bacterium]